MYNEKALTRTRIIIFYFYIYIFFCISNLETVFKNENMKQKNQHAQHNLISCPLEELLPFFPPLSYTDRWKESSGVSKLEEAMKIGGDNCILTGPSVTKPRQWQLIQTAWLNFRKKNHVGQVDVSCCDWWIVEESKIISFSISLVFLAGCRWDQKNVLQEKRSVSSTLFNCIKHKRLNPLCFINC